MYIKSSAPWFTLFFLALVSESAGAKMRAYLTQIQCLTSTDLLQNVSCQINEKSRSALTVEFALTKDLNDIKGHFLLSVERDSIAADYISMDMDYCELLQSQHKNYIVRTLTNDVRRTSNFPVECPFKMNKRYFVKEYSVDLKILPSYIPEIKFKTDMKIKYNGKLAVNFILHGKIIRN